MTKREELAIIGKALDVSHGGRFEIFLHYFGRSGMEVIIRALPLEVSDLGEELEKFNFNTKKPLEAQHYGSYEQFMDSLLLENPS